MKLSKLQKKSIDGFYYGSVTLWQQSYNVSFSVNVYFVPICAIVLLLLPLFNATVLYEYDRGQELMTDVIIESKCALFITPQTELFYNAF